MSGRRRDIGNSLVFLGLLLILLIGYHGWFREPPPAAPPVPVSVEPAVTTAPPRPAPAPRDPSVPLFEPPVPQTSAPQTEEPPALPREARAQSLLAIRSLIERGDDAGARTALESLPRQTVLDPALRPYVATLWNNLGVLESRRHGSASAIPLYIKGLDLDPGNPTLNLNLAHAYRETQDPRLTREFLQKLTTLVPEDPFPQLALAEVLAAEDDLAGAAGALDRAAPLAQGNSELANYLLLVRTKIEQAQAERSLLARKSEHFVVKFDGAEHVATWNEVLQILEEAYRDIGQQLGYFPSQPIHVVLMGQEAFRSAQGTPAWADALFDPVLGRIKVPVEGALTNRAWLTRVLRHEYVHALLHERMGLEAGKVPTWLNEGLAMQLAGDAWPDIDQLAHGGDLTLLPLSGLEKSWGALSPEVATLAYLEASSATRYMIDRFGMARVLDVLDLLKSGHSLSDAIHHKLMITYETFQERWTREIERRLAARRV